MSSLLEARCPRCGSDFHCGRGDAGPCGCTGVALDADLQRRLREHFTGCLCLSCLRALADGAALDPPRSPVTR